MSLITDHLFNASWFIQNRRFFVSPLDYLCLLQNHTLHPGFRFLGVKLFPAFSYDPELLPRQ